MPKREFGFFELNSQDPDAMGKVMLFVMLVIIGMGCWGATMSLWESGVLGLMWVLPLSVVAFFVGPIIFSVVVLIIMFAFSEFGKRLGKWIK